MGSELMYGMSWYDSQPKVTTRKTFFFSIFNCFVLGSKQHFYDHVVVFHARATTIYLCLWHFWLDKGMCYSHQYSDAFTSDILSFLRMIIKFDYPNICFKENSHKKVHMIIKMMLILRYAKKKHFEMR